MILASGAHVDAAADAHYLHLVFELIVVELELCRHGGSFALASSAGWMLAASS